MNIKYSFILTTFAGLSTLIGFLTIFLKTKKQDTIITSALAFASGIMISASFFDLIVESFDYYKDSLNTFIIILLIGIFFSIGILLSNFMNKNINPNGNNLYKVGITSMLAIIIHNIPEGIITFLTSFQNPHLGLHLAIAISLHNIPEGIAIALPIYYSTKNKKKALLFTIIAALSEPLGALLAFLFLKNFITNILIASLLSLIAGIMTNIALYELLPESLSYNKKLLSIISFLIGLIFMYITVNVL
ncbi:MAG: ZIP family metal transporter [Bacilli bacterium]|nr:ZIP family metal transporter [Bacilli bacterium]